MHGVHMTSGEDMEEILAAMMGGGMMHPGMHPGMRRKRKGRDVGMVYPTTLEDVYNGKKNIVVPREKTVVDDDAQNKGSSQTTDPYGRRVVRTKTIDAPLKFDIERGMKDEQQIPFMNEGDQHPEIDIPGHVVIILNIEKHDVFKREGDDLKMKHKLSLAEALCGFQFIIKHLDGRELVVASNPKGEVIRPGDQRAIVGEGMPKHKTPTQFGDLIITFEIDFPSSLTEDSIETLSKVLPPPAAATDCDKEEAEECHLTPAPIDQVKEEMAKAAADDEDDDDGQGGVRCAQS